MSKKNKDKNKNKRPARQVQLPQFRDMTSERYFNNQMAKAERLYEAEKYHEAIEVLEELTGRFGERAALYDLLGISYASANHVEQARDAFERALFLAGDKPAQLTRFNLAQLYMMSEYYFLAYEQSQLIDCYELSRETGQTSDMNKCKDFRAASQELVENEAKQNGRPLDQFLEFGLALDRGRLALSKQELTTAREQFLKASQLDRTMAAAFNNLALVYMLENDPANAEESSNHVLKNIDAGNRTALSHLVRIRVIQGNREGAQEFLQQLQALSEPEEPEEILKVAEASAAMEDDQQVLDLLLPLMDEIGEVEDLDSAGYEEAVTFGVVAAANLGQNMRALEFLQEAKPFTRSTLLERTYYALENNERGPRAGGRFYYFDPITAYPPAAAFFQQLAVELDEQDSVDYREGLQRFFRQFGESALEVAAYKFWTDREPELVADLLAQAIASGVEGAEEMVRRFAFSRVGDDLQRLTALKVLVEQGKVKEDERVKIWIGQRQVTGTPHELTRRYNPRAAHAGQTGENLDPAIAAMLNKALELMRQGDRDGAIRQYRQVIEKNSRVKQAYQNLAALLSGKGEMEEAIRNIQEALKIDTDYVQAQIALAQLWLGSGQLDKAEAQLDSLRDKLSGYYVDELEAYYYARIALYSKQERYPEMKAALGELLELDPENAWAEKLLSQLESTGKITEL